MERAVQSTGEAICFTAVTDRPEATSTNGDLFTVALSGGEPRRITTNPGFDGHPVYSPDGHSIAYHAQFVAGYESDRWRLMLYDRATQKTSNLTEAFDRSVQEPLWSPDSRRIYFVAEDQAEQPIYAIDVAPEKDLNTRREAKAMSAPSPARAGVMNAATADARINTISWTDGDHRYTLSGPLTPKELEAIKPRIMKLRR